MRGWALALCWVVAGCGGEGRASDASPPAQTVLSGDSRRPVHARLSVVDLEGRPVANMMPIATARANAFDRPVARGELTDTGGVGELVLPPDQRLYVRAWDPVQGLFANNYYEVFPGSGAETEAMQIVMAPGAAFEATVYGPAGNPVSMAVVHLTLYHPTEGAWWPDRSVTAANGALLYPSVPPGTYTARLEVEGLGWVEIPDLRLPPGGRASLGVVVLQPASEAPEQ